MDEELGPKVLSGTGGLHLLVLATIFLVKKSEAFIVYFVISSIMFTHGDTIVRS